MSLELPQKDGDPRERAERLATKRETYEGAEGHRRVRVQLELP